METCSVECLISHTITILYVSGLNASGLLKGLCITNEQSLSCPKLGTSFPHHNQSLSGRKDTYHPKRADHT